MNITFLIGNGFDLNLGMNTRYTDMYESYINSKSNNEVIAQFKNDLKKEEHNHYQNWSDFEMGMANYASNYYHEDNFITCIRDFKAHMVKHLKEEEQNFKFNKKQATNILWDSIRNFYTGSTPNVTYILDDIISRDKYCHCSFITFNYTHILDSIIGISSTRDFIKEKPYDIRQALHIHGDLDNDIVLGVDDTTQIRSGFHKTRKTDLAFIKPKFNDAYDSRRVKQALDTITYSSIICAFGLSLGESDKTWTIALKNWLLADENHHLIFYVYNDEEIPSYNYDAKIEKEYEFKDALFHKMGLTKEEIRCVEEKIHIPINHSIFKFTKQQNIDELAVV